MINDQTEWLRWRSTGIGASDVAGILGVSPWHTPYTIWLSKLHPDLTDDDAEHLAWGHLLEDVICQEAARRLGLVLAGMQAMRHHPDHPHHLATIDAETRPPGPLIEAKVTADRDEWEDVPLHYWCQCQWQMHVTGSARVVLAVLHAGQRLALHTIDRDDTDIAVMVDAVDRFWTDHVLTRTPPMATGRDIPALNRTPATPGRELAADPADIALYEQWRTARFDADRMAAYADELRATLCERLGDATDLIGPDGRRLVTWRPTTELDTDAVTRDHPDLVAEHTAPVTDWPAVRKALGRKRGAPYLTPTGRRRFLDKTTDQET